MEISENIQAILATLPAKPGCYLMQNGDGKIIYVGKAISLKNRVRSYFHADASHDAKTRRLVREISHLEWIVVGSELEALILEMNLIKKHRQSTTSVLRMINVIHISKSIGRTRSPKSQ